MTSAAVQAGGRVPAWFCGDVLVPFAVSRLGLTLVGLFVSAGNWLGIWSGWDGGWYLSIARNGYVQHATEQSNTAFAPALPLVMHLVGVLVGDEANSTVILIGGFVAVNAALLIALGYLVALTRLDFDAGTARRAALYALVFPSTLFLSAVYPHAFFLAGAVPAFYYARRGRWWLAGAFAALAVLSRVQGLLILLPLALEYLAQRRFDLRRIKPDAGGLLLPVVAVLAYATLMFVQVGDALAMLHAAATWGREPSAPWDTILSFITKPVGEHGSDRSPLDLAFTFLLVALVVVSWARLRRSLALFSATFLLFSLSSGLLVSSMRYGLELFPVFIALAISGRYRAFHFAYLAIAGYLALRFMSEFAQGLWVA